MWLSRTLLSWILEDAMISFSAALCPLFLQWMNVFHPPGAGLLKGGFVRSNQATGINEGTVIWGSVMFLGQIKLTSFLLCNVLHAMMHTGSNRSWRRAQPSSAKRNQMLGGDGGWGIWHLELIIFNTANKEYTEWKGHCKIDAIHHH